MFSQLLPDPDGENLPIFVIVLGCRRRGRAATRWRRAYCTHSALALRRCLCLCVSTTRPIGACQSHVLRAWGRQTRITVSWEHSLCPHAWWLLQEEGGSTYIAEGLGESSSESHLNQSRLTQIMHAPSYGITLPILNLQIITAIRCGPNLTWCRLKPHTYQRWKIWVEFLLNVDEKFLILSSRSDFSHVLGCDPS